ncbi:Arylsulfatase precursor [Anaerohalosphaera lusitana]|uniref:Arylsulfatase n=1 Tax=Anaerohalosphaera lusitana TaxID=1936003 RepID=A0A1U9NIK7_9BACT|nr:sulfatase-like hydrolase/transferase [Anaerohalosphaera lusitana]AQT67578.1 Arylsulfatase precursor [Anaerohalosphaera lusitana]
MDRRDFLKLAGVTAGAAGLNMSFASAKLARAEKRKPNVIYIMLDELGYFELSCMGNEKVHTPNIDRMVSEGMRFTQMLAGSAVCAPTRSVLMTGKHAGHTTVRVNGGGLALLEDDATIASMLKCAGYATGGFGKWGLGDAGTTGVPEKHGFDTFYGYYHQVHAHTYYPRYLLRNSEKEYLPGNTDDFYEGETFAHYKIFEEAKKFIKSNADKPFFCYCPWTPPHGLWGMPEDDPSWQMYEDKPWRAGQRQPTDSRVYAAMINMVDRQIGEIMDMVKELGIDEDTIIFFCGDNGGQPYFCWGDPSTPRPEKMPYPHGFIGPNLNPETGERFRGGKGNLYEGGLRIPFIVRWPGKVEAGSVSEHLGYFPDVMPTLGEICGADVPTDTDGISFAPTLCGEKAAGREQDEHEYLYWEFGRWIAVRYGDHKLVTRRNNKGRAELYDLSEDIEEQNNIAAEKPDVVKKLLAFADVAHTKNKVGTYLPGTEDIRFDGLKVRHH